MREGLIRPCIAGAHYCASALLTAAVWTGWLLLALLFALQIYVASVKELQIPRFLLRAIEDHLAESGISVKFGRAIFDPSGRVLLERARFRLASFAEPVVTADAIYIRLDPWALFERRFEAREIRAIGANLFIPAMLSSSGRAEKMVQDLDAGFSITSRGDEFSVDYLNCRLGGIALSAHGTVNAGHVAKTGKGAATSLPLAEFVSKNYVVLSREFSKAEEQMSGLNQAIVTAVLTPSDTRGAIVYAELGAAALSLGGPFPVEASGLHAETRFPLLGGAPLMTTLVCTADDVKLGGKVEVTGVRLLTRGILQVDTLSFSPKQLDVTAGSVTGEGAVVSAPIVRIVPKEGRIVTANVTAWLFDGPVWAGGELDLASKSASIAFDGLFSPSIIDALSGHLHTDIRRFADLTEPVAVSGRVRLARGWKFQDVTSHVDGRNFTAYHVHFDEARGDVSFDGAYLAARRALARSGDNFASGSYEQNFPTRAYRYLLSGRLRPLDISPWFPGDWWQGLFKHFEFPAQPAEANVDVRGHYVRYRDFSVFGYVTAKQPVLVGVPFDGVRTLLFVDENGCEGLDFSAKRNAGEAQGSFRLATEPVNGRWSSLDIDVSSTIDPAPLGKLLPAEGGAAIATFEFAHAPSIYARGHFDGPAAPGDRHKLLHMDVKAVSDLRIHGVAFEKASFKVDLKDDIVSVDDIEAGFAGGTLTGSAQVSGAGTDRRIRFKASLDGASLGQAAAAGAGYVLKKKEGNSTALETFARDKSGVGLDLNVSGEGKPGDLGSFSGDGNFQVQGAQLGEVALLGGLSKFLKFPELRFTQARAEFKIENTSIVIPDLSVIGANSAIKAKGIYAIDRRQLDFSATVYPFQESRFLLQIFNALSTPISAVFRVRLTGSIDKPSWSLAYSPLNLLKTDDLKVDAGAKSTPPATPTTPKS